VTDRCCNRSPHGLPQTKNTVWVRLVTTSRLSVEFLLPFISGPTYISIIAYSNSKTVEPIFTKFDIEVVTLEASPI
jgi:hypothetical protein